MRFCASAHDDMVLSLCAEMRSNVFLYMTETVSEIWITTILFTFKKKIAHSKNA